MDGAAEHAAESALCRFRFGRAEFDESRLQLTVDDQAVDLEHRPLRVLSELLRHAGKVVTRKHLFREVWDNRTETPEVLTNAIVKLRKALGPQDCDNIVTVPRVGYRLDGKVERIEVARQLDTVQRLIPGQPVPLRENFVLEALLGRSQGKETWLARQVKTGEPRVFKFTPDVAWLASLEREAQLHRLLRVTSGDRDDFERVIDWNFEVAPFFLECEYGGIDLTTWFESEGLRHEAARSARLELFLQIADAVAAAHSVGVLHENLKPAKVLIARRANGSVQVRIADFGGGRLLDPTLLEALGIVNPGKPVEPDKGPEAARESAFHLAPELIGGGTPTVQCDVYSLGVMLYQIIVGDLRRPLAPGWERDIADDLLAADIAAATSGDPARRMANVVELTIRLRDLGARHLARARDRGLEQRAAAAEQALQQARVRRPWMMLAAVSLILGFATSLVFYRQERTARLQAEAAGARAEAINNFLSDDLLTASDPSGAAGYADPTMHQVLQRAVERLDSRFADDPATKATLELSVSQAYYGMSDFAQAETHARRAVALLSGALNPDDPLALLANYRLAVVLSQHDRLDEAHKLLDRTDLAAGSQITVNSRLALQAHWARASYYKMRFAVDKSLAEFAVADRIRSAIDPDNIGVLFRVKQGLGWCYLRQSKNELAVHTLRPLMAPGFTIGRVGPAVRGQVRLDYGAALMATGKIAEAEIAMRDALGTLRSALGPDHFYVGLAQNFLGGLYADQSRWADAADSVGDANRIFRLGGDAHSQAVLVTAANLGILDEYADRMPSAIATLSSTHEALAAKVGAKHPQAQAVAFYLSVALQESGRPAEALRLFEGLNVRDLVAAEPRDDWQPRLDALHAAILLQQGQASTAAPQLEAAIAMMKKNKTPPVDIRPFEKALAAASTPTR